MKTIIENLQALVDSVEFAETEYKANYVITTQDKKLLTEALNEALHLHSVMQAEGSDVSEGAAVGQRSVGTNAEARANCAEGKHFWSMNKGIQQCLFCPAWREAPSDGQP